MTNMIKIDGSYGEGGGQILRTAIALSCITGEAVEVYNIRANRPKPGLAMQHVKGIEAAREIANAKVEGLKKGSTKITFFPGKVKGKQLKIDVGTAGSVTLILQVISPISMVADREVEVFIKGGTDVNWSPPVDYMKNVTFYGLKKMGGKAELLVLERGYYPKGGGKVRAFFEPSKLLGLEFKPEKVKVVKGVSHCQNLPAHVAERQAKSAKELLPFETEIEIEVRKGISTGSGITLWCGLIGGSSLGEKGKKAEVVGREAANRFLEGVNSKAALDEWVGDQIMVFASIASGVTKYTVSKVTMHQISNAYVINKFFDNCVKIDEEKREILIRGAGIT